jgi:sulfate transport system substrate-binding protein
MATRKVPWLNLAAIAAAILAVTLIIAKNVEGKIPAQLLNVSYDPTRELYRDINAAFSARYQKESGR